MSQDNSHTRTCFVVSDGRRGIENQALGLAEAVGRLTPLRLMPIHLPRTGGLEDPGPLQPELWIGCGRAAVRAAELHRQSFPDACMVYIQHPRRHVDLFDLVIPPRHDHLTGPNVFPILGSPNRITPERLNEGAAGFEDQVNSLPHPRVAVLIGGDSKHHRMSPAVQTYLIERLESLHVHGVSLMITVSRRTPDSLVQLLKNRLGEAKRVWLHTGDGSNPYFAFLKHADWIFVTEDSTNMLTEAASTGKPVYRLGMDGQAGKFVQLYEELEATGAVRPWLGELEEWSYEPLHETARAAHQVLAFMDQTSKIVSNKQTRGG